MPQPLVLYILSPLLLYSTWTPFHFLQYAKPIFASGPLRLLVPLPQIFFSESYVTDLSLIFRSKIKYPPAPRMPSQSLLANVNEHLLCTHSIFTIIITLMDKEAETKGRKATCPRPHRKSSSSRLTPELKVLTTTLPFSHSPFEIWRQLTSVPIMEVYPPRKEFLILFSRKGSSHCYLDRVK